MSRIIAVGVLMGLTLTISPATSTPAPDPPPEPAAAPAAWDAESWLREQWPRLPYGEHAELVVSDLSEGRALPDGSTQKIDAYVDAADPGAVQVDAAWLASLGPEDATAARALMVHELSHAAVFQDGRLLPPDMLLDDGGADWAAPVLGMPLDHQYQALEAVAACVEQSGLGPGAAVGYLSGQCPTEYRERVFEYLAEITGEDWRPKQLKS